MKERFEFVSFIVFVAGFCMIPECLLKILGSDDTDISNIPLYVAWISVIFLIQYPLLYSPEIDRARKVLKGLTSKTA